MYLKCSFIRMKDNISTHSQAIYSSQYLISRVGASEPCCDINVGRLLGAREDDVRPRAQIECRSETFLALRVAHCL
jgi:hypothetical protein